MCASLYDAVAFDLDGTFYPNYRLYIKLLPFLAKEHRLLFALGKARTLLRAGEHTAAGDFYEQQAGIMAEILNVLPQAVKERTERLIYRGWEPLFKKVRLYPYVTETLHKLHSAGIKLAVLSDFPPVHKLENLGIDSFFDVVLCSEEIGALKPDPAPFMALIKTLSVPVNRILYVGNSIRYDMAGAKNAGLSAALIQPPLTHSRQHNSAIKPDFTFGDYRRLVDFVLREEPSKALEHQI
jgi:putative hydrolase of the HAD superfamily